MSQRFSKRRALAALGGLSALFAARSAKAQVPGGIPGPQGPPGVSGIDITDGTHAVAGATTLTVAGATISGTTPNATMTPNYISTPYSDGNVYLKPLVAGGKINLYSSNGPTDVTADSGGGQVYIKAGDGKPVDITHRSIGGDVKMYAGVARAGYSSFGGQLLIGGGPGGPSEAGGVTNGGRVVIVGGYVTKTGTYTPGNVILKPGGTYGGTKRGYIALKNLPTVAPSYSGALWRDPVSNAIFIVP